MFFNALQLEELFLASFTVLALIHFKYSPSGHDKTKLYWTKDHEF